MFKIFIFDAFKHQPGIARRSISPFLAKIAIFSRKSANDDDFLLYHCYYYYYYCHFCQINSSLPIFNF